MPSLTRKDAMPRRVIQIRVLGSTWLVPYGFGVVYGRVAAEHIEYDRTGKPERLLETVSDMLGLVGYEAPAEVVKGWNLRKRVEAEVYAANVHARASDNPIRKHPRPAWMPDAWLGPERGSDVWGGPGPTPL
jgi:hypothetical protein